MAIYSEDEDPNVEQWEKQDEVNIQVNINGFFDIIFQNVYTGEDIKEKDIKLGILDNLQQGEYIIGFDSGNVYDINDLTQPVYKFTLSVTDSVEYDFDEE